MYPDEFLVDFFDYLLPASIFLTGIFLFILIISAWGD